MRILRRLALTIAVAVVLPCFAESTKQWPSNPTSPTAPWSLAEAAALGHFNGATWSLSIEYKKEDYPLLSRDEFIANLAASADADPAAEKRADRRANRRLLKANLDATEAVVRAVPSIVGETLIALLGKGDDSVLFARRGETRCLIVPTLGVAEVYNTLRMEPKERAQKIATMVALPALRAMSEVDKLDKAGIKCIGVGVSFGAKSFAAGGPPLADMTMSEFLQVTGLVSDVRLLAKGELAEEELLGRVDVFSQDRTMGPEVKKILLGVRP
jgi:hypothetical protein